MTRWGIFFVAQILLAQSTVTVRVGPNDPGKGTVIQTRNTKTVISSISCTPTMAGLTPIEPGETATCVVVLNQVARLGGFTFSVILSPDLTGPTTGIVVVGQSTTTFTVTYSPTATNNKAVVAPIYPGVMQMASKHYADIEIPCCGVSDRCAGSLSSKEVISQSPCAKRIAGFAYVMSH
jgi:hypothetical protein